MGISDWSSDVCSSDLCLAVGQLHDQGVFRIAGLSPGRWGQAGQQLTWQQQTGQQAENKKMPAVHTKLLTRKISPKSAPEDQPWAPCAFTTATRARRRSATRGETKGLMSPSSMAISFTSREAMNWWLSEAIRKTEIGRAHV